MRNINYFTTTTLGIIEDTIETIISTIAALNIHQIHIIREGQL